MQITKKHYDKAPNPNSIPIAIHQGNGPLIQKAYGAIRSCVWPSNEFPKMIS